MQATYKVTIELQHRDGTPVDTTGLGSQAVSSLNSLLRTALMYALNSGLPNKTDSIIGFVQVARVAVDQSA